MSWCSCNAEECLQGWWGSQEQLLAILDFDCSFLIQCDLHHGLYVPISFSSFAFSPSTLLTLFSTSTVLPSHSLQHSLPSNIPASYHRCIACALLALSSDIALACESCRSFIWASRGCSAINAAEDSAGATGRSLTAWRHDAVV